MRQVVHAGKNTRPPVNKSGSGDERADRPALGRWPGWPDPGAVSYTHLARLLEANVRSFLSVTGKVNRGIRDTLINNPEHFMAYNNGIVILADEIRLETAAGGLPGILWMGGMQIVNGGQTTASIYFTKKKEPQTDLKRVRIPAKIIILRSDDAEAEENMISAVSRYANSQNAVRQADLSANRSFHVLSLIHI